MAEEIRTSSTKNRRACMRRRPRGKVKVACFKGEFDLGQNIAIGVADLSESGVMLLLRTPLDRGQHVTLALEGHDHMRPVKIQGRIVWCVPMEKDIYRAGVQVDKYLRYQDVMKIT